MPEKFHGLTDTETRYRQRYLDLMTNPESMANFQKRVAIMECFRDVLRNRGFIEVETPVLQPIYGGAAARPFTTHHNTLDMDLFLRISPELYLKRLLVGGMEKVYEFARNFRNEGIDTRHNPEFTMMELYQAYADYEVMMDITEEMLATAAERVRAKAKELGLDPENKDDAVVVNDVFEETVEEHLIQPTFVMDYPAELCPLTRRKSDDPSLALRFECFIAGMELANAYTELNDPAVQEENFRAQVRGEAEGETMRVMDEDFLTALAHGMPPAGGLGMGLDRAIMLLTGTTSIRDVVLFPQLRSIVRTEQAPDEGETQDVE
jgi:lysyl-tRNA synthetase class 2